MLYTVGKVLKISFQRYITCPQSLEIAAGNTKKTNLQSFKDWRSGWYPGKASGKANGIGQGGNTGRGPASKRGMYPS
jgi:hypothetical protein